MEVAGEGGAFQDHQVRETSLEDVIHLYSLKGFGCREVMGCRKALGPAFFLFKGKRVRPDLF